MTYTYYDTKHTSQQTLTIKDKISETSNSAEGILLNGNLVMLFKYKVLLRFRNKIKINLL
jgi:hypothetical protein